jgi:uncharacterized membrane protein
MTDVAPAPGISGQSAADPSLVSYTHWMYALHALSALIGVFGSAFVATAFVFGIPSIIAVIMNYLKRDEARGTYLETHFSWQLRTFWFALFWMVVIGIVSAPLMLVLVGFATWMLGILVVGIWIIYRVLRGWLRLREGRPV